MRNIDKRRFRRCVYSADYISRTLKLIDVTDYETEQMRREAELANAVLLERVRRMENYMINVEQLNKRK